jgi:hypothetical protein
MNNLEAAFVINSEKQELASLEEIGVLRQSDRVLE